MLKKFVQFLLKIFFGILFQHKLYASGNFRELFAEIRIWDAPLELLEKLVPKKGLIVDLGCGDGLITNYLALKAPERYIVGVDKNKLRIKDADQGISNTKFILGDVLSKQVPKANAILMVHLLHHLSSLKDQEVILKKAKQRLKREGNLIIVEIDRKPLLKYLLTWIVDRSVFPILFEGKNYSSEIFYRGGNEWKVLLEKMGFNVRVITAHKGKPFSHIILVCEKC